MTAGRSDLWPRGSALRRDGEYVLFRSDAEDGAHTVLVVATASQQPQPRSIERLKHEHALRDSLHPAWAAQPLTLAEQDGRTLLVLADPGGELLSSLLGKPWDTKTFLRVAIGIAAALGRVHAQGLIHKDVKPHHVLVDRASGAAWLTGFGIASLLARERQAPDLPETIAGTLAYMAPEQTGRMNRSVDARSDLYALGVTLYQMLTGELPFTASDPMELVHCHIARRPVPPAERAAGVPPVVSDIVMKLLAKTSEERYQTAAGASADLRRCLEMYEASGSLEAFPLGGQDIPDVLRIPEKLYGRAQEVAALLGAFERVVSRGTPELVLVSGYSGIGKSSVVNELHKAIVPPRGLFASGKFEQYRRDVPYATLSQAFQTLVRQLLAKSEAEVAPWRQALVEALGANGELMVRIIPELELLMGKQAPVPELPPQEAQGRFQRVFRRLLGVFARPEHPLVLFLDDLQWLDAATLTLLVDLATQSEVGHLLLVGAYRDNEVGPSHPLMRCLHEIRGAGATVSEIVLAPLALHDVGTLIADSLHCDAAAALPLAALVHEKTAGNPFFTIQFLGALAEEKLLGYDGRAAAWVADLERIHAKGYTDNVVDLMVGKLARLPDDTREGLKQLACLGSVARFATLGRLFGQSAEAAHASLWQALRDGLLLEREGGFAFVHDRVQEAAYSLIPPESRPQVHLRIGRVLLSGMHPDEVIDVVDQMNRGAVLLEDREERERVAELNLRAGRRAKSSTAYASACTYLAAGMALLDEAGWSRRYELTFALSLERAECEYLSGNFDRADALIEQLLARSASRIDKAAVYRLRIDVHVLRMEYPQAVEAALACLRLFGIDMPAHPTTEQVAVEFDQVWRNLAGRPIEELLDLHEMTDPDVRAAMDVLAVLYAPAVFTDSNLVQLHLCHMVNMTLRYGTCHASPNGYAWFGVVTGTRLGRYRDGYRFGKLACDLVEKLGLVAYKAKAYFPAEMTALWAQPVSIALDYIRAAHRVAVEGGDLTIGCYSCNHTVTDLLLRGDPLDEVWLETERGLEFARKAKFRDVIDVIIAQQRFIQNMRGRTASFSSFSDATFDEPAFEAELTEQRMATMVCWYWVIKLQARFLSGDYGAALDAARKAKALLWSSDGHIQLLDYYFYTALATAAAWHTFPPEAQGEARELLAAHLRQLSEWAENGAVTFRDRHALVLAETARVEGRALDAERLYEEAIRLSREHRFIQNEALGNELAGRFHAARGLGTVAHAYLRNARYCYLRWGAHGKVQQLEQQHAQLREEPAPLNATATTSAPATQLDFAAVVNLSQAVSGEIVLENLIDKLMSISLKHAGAQRGLLILPHGEELRIDGRAVTAADLPESVLRYVVRTHNIVLLDDASLPNPYSSDPYIAQNHSRSILCLPLLKQAKLIGVLYLENPLAARVFTPARIAVLDLLASQAAISLENARLYADLRRSEERYALAVQAAGDGHSDWIVATDELYASPRLLEMLGLPAETRFAGRADYLARIGFHPEDRERALRTLEEFYAGDGTRLDLDMRILRGSETRWLHSTVLCARDSSGAVQRSNSAVTDITERKLAEEALRQAQRLEAMGALAGGIAHDFNNILGAIVGFGEMALRDAAKGSRLRRDLESVMAAGERGRALVDRVLAFSRSGVGERVAVHVEKVVREALDLLEAKLPEGVRLDAELDADRAALLGDPTQVHQVVMNLGTNAAHAMPHGGVLSVRLSVERFETSRAATIGGVDKGEYLVLCIADTGVGIAPDIVARIFDPFFTTKDVGVGTGLGLSLVHGIVTQVGGAIDVASTVGSGSTFTVYLPRSGDAADSEESAELALPRGDGQRVLVVDDEAVLVQLATRTLEGLGYVPVGFTSSRAALAAFRAEPQRFDAVITDERMAGVSGSALIREMRGIRSSIPVVLMSGYVGGGVASRARDAGADEVLKKPLLARDLAASLARVLHP
jgi:predicted ATPase/signal transduction histidine kinase